MLAHQKVSTAESFYIEDGLTQTKKAQDIFD
jgi:hypothetical protein